MARGRAGHATRTQNTCDAVFFLKKYDTNTHLFRTPGVFSNERCAHAHQGPAKGQAKAAAARAGRATPHAGLCSAQWTGRLRPRRERP